MRKYKLILLLFLLNKLVVAQIPVTDVALNASMGQSNALRMQANMTMMKDLTESIAQTNNMVKTYKLAKAAADRINKVSSFINRANTIVNIISNQKQQYTRIKEVLASFQDNKYVTMYEIKYFQSCISRFLSNTDKSISLLNQIIKPGKSKMNDADRLTIINSLEKEINSENSMVNLAIKDIDMIVAQRKAIIHSQEVMKKVFTGN